MALTQLKTSGIADDAVTTDKLANAINTERTANTAKVSLTDNSVTLAKMAGGTDGQIITYDASGDPVAVGPGTDGQVLTSTGAGSPPAFEAIPASGISDVVSDTSPQLGGNLDVNTKNITFGDSGGSTDDRLTFGAGTDLSIYHQDSNSTSYLYNTSTDLTLMTGGTNVNIKSDTGEFCAKFVKDGAVELYHNNSKKFETSSSGAVVTGSLEATDDLILSGANANLRWDKSDDALEFMDQGKAVFGTDNDAFIKHTGSDLLIENDTGAFNIKCTSGTGVGEGVIYFASGNGTTRTVLQSDGHFRPFADAAYYLGTSSYRWLNVYTSDLDLSNEAKGGNDIDGTWGHWTIQEGESDLFLKNNRSNKKYKFNLTEVT